jgi:hypothetical protein
VVDKQIKTTSLATFIKIGDVTIAIPPNTPMGLTIRHPDDKDNGEIGQAISYYRMRKEMTMNLFKGV